MRRLASVLLLLALPAAVAGQDPAEYFAHHMVIDADAAPNGSLIAYTVRVAVPAVDSFRHVVEVIPADGGDPWTLGDGRQPSFAPEGRAIAWLVATGDAWQLAVRDSLAGETRVITDLPAGVTAWRWSPDATAIVFSAPALSRAGQAMRYPAGDRNARQALYMLPAAGGEVRRLTGEDFAVGPEAPELERLVQFDWLGERELIVSGRVRGSSEPAEAASLFVVNVDDRSRRYLAGEGGRWHLPVVSPDREWIAFAGQPLGTPTWAASELLVLRPDGGGLRRLTVGLDRDVLDLAWAGNRDIWFATEDRGSRNLHRLDARSGRIRGSTSGLHLLSLASIPRRGGWAVAIRSTWAIAGELIRFALDRPAEFRTLVAPDAPAAIGEVEELEFRAGDGTALGAWLVRPPRFDPAQRYPLLVEIHGGPHAMAGTGYAPGSMAHAAAGWLVLRVNPRGSTGFGFDIANGLHRTWPGQDVADIRAALHDVLSRGMVDSTRIAVAGSGAGAVTAAALRRQEPLARAAILRCPGGGWLPGGAGVDPAPWREWHAARPFRMAASLWLDRSPLHDAAATRQPVLVMEGSAPEPEAVAFAASYHLQLGRAGIAGSFIRVPGRCADAGPASQATLFSAERQWLTQHARPD
jgi:dipeptidyl aminopeptidase/acylaminoacyl peptidase